MDHEYAIRTGPISAEAVTQTVMLFQSSLLQLPRFTLRPTHLFNKIGSVFGYQGIDFDSHSTFSNQYLLQSADEEVVQTVRNIFSDKFLAYYYQCKGLSIEGDGDKLIFYRESRRVLAQDIQSFLEEGLRIFSLIKIEG